MESSVDHMVDVFTIFMMHCIGVCQLVRRLGLRRLLTNKYLFRRLDSVLKPENSIILSISFSHNMQDWRFFINLWSLLLFRLCIGSLLLGGSSAQLADLTRQSISVGKLYLVQKQRMEQGRESAGNWGVWVWVFFLFFFFFSLLRHVEQSA